MSDSSIPPDPLDDAAIEDFLGSIAPQDITEEPPVEDFEIPQEPPADDTLFEESTVQIGDGSCNVCGAPTFRPPGLTPTGRKKRAPKYCDLHDPKLRVSKEGPIIGGVGEAQLQRVQSELADEIRLLGTLAGPMLPVTGYYAFINADPCTVALLKLFKNNQAVLRVFHRVATVAPIYQLARIGAGVAYSVQVDTKKADPHNTIAQRLGVDAVYDTVYPNEVAQNGQPAGFQGPPVYATA